MNFSQKYLYLLSHTTINTVIDMNTSPVLIHKSILFEQKRVVYIFHPDILAKVDQDISQAFLRNENKVKLLSRAER